MSEATRYGVFEITNMSKQPRRTDFSSYQEAVQWFIKTYGDNILFIQSDDEHPCCADMLTDDYRQWVIEPAQ